MTTDEFLKDVLTVLCEIGLRLVRPTIPSDTLARALTVIDGVDRYERILEIPHYWAIYVHDGRGPFGVKRAKFLVWFRNPKEDPRTGFGSLYPVRANDNAIGGISRLTKEEFHEGLRRNAEARAVGAPVPMIVVKYQPRVTLGVPFFEDLHFETTASAEVIPRFEDLVLSEIRPYNTNAEAIARIG